MATDQNRVILGPLTTATWESPASCAVVVEGCAGTSTCSYGYQAQSCYATPSGSTISYGDEDNTDCWPPRASFVTTPIPPLTGWGFYSPGIICPTGMIQACTATYGGASGWPVQFGLTEGETAIGCCPSSFHCTNSIWQTCVQSATSTSFQVVTCESGSSAGLTYLTLPTTVSAIAISTYTLYAPMIQINWRSSDSLSSSATSTPTSSATSSSLPPTGTSASSQGLSSGAKAGIGVGIALGVLAVLALAFFIYRKRQNAYTQTRQDSPTATQPAAEQPVYELHTKKGSYPMAELSTGRVSELPSGEEMRPGERQIYETHG